MTALAGAIALTPAIASHAGPRDAIVAGDMQAVTQEIETLYADHGLSWADWIKWKIGPYTTHYWYYDDKTYEIVVGAIPKPDEVGAYWRNWSRTLTDGNWDADGFFTSDIDALEMARFNQWVLATHESAHAITFRYDSDHRRRHDYHVNCREYYADRLTAAILQDEAMRDADMARWRAQYLDLVTAMGASIPEEYRVEQADHAALEADCTVMSVGQPTPDKMQAYASAYFARYKALLEAELPPLDAVFQTHLKDRAAAVAERYPFAEDWAGREIKTLRRGRLVHSHFYLKAEHLEGDYGDRVGALAPDGTPRIAESRFDAETGRLYIAFGPPEGRIDLVLDGMTWPRPARDVEIESIAVFGDDEFYAGFDAGSDGSAVYKFTRSGDHWTPTVILEESVFGESHVFRVGDDRLVIAQTRGSGEPFGLAYKMWRTAELDRETGEELRATSIPVEASYPIGADGEGRLYFSAWDIIVRTDRDATISRVAGSALEGHRDGPAGEAQIAGAMMLQFEEDGGALLLDTAVNDGRMQYIRRVTPAPAQ